LNRNHRMRIRLFGIYNQTGIGTHALNIYNCLVQYKLKNIEIQKFSHFNESEVNAAIADSLDTDVNLHFYPSEYAPMLKGKNIYWSVFESTRPIPGYEQWDKTFDLILSPSEWGRQCMINYGIAPEKTAVVPEGIDPVKFHPFRTSPPPKIPRFLMIGKYENRKSYPEAFEAFHLAHQQNPNFELWIKADWINGVQSVQHPEFLELCAKYSHLPITVVQGIASDEQMLELYHSATHFVFPSKCEGWGLPLLEAIACGLKVIATDFGGQSEFLRSTKLNTRIIPYQISEIVDMDWRNIYPHIDSDFGKWAFIDTLGLSDIIRNSIDEEIKEFDLKDAIFIRDKFSWRNSTDSLLAILHK
jgi:glycosyltransferase involved in cell wall biosynthesis